ncbi:tyrosine-type recombinase/integrase [Sulfurimonas sp. SAG-AH-194-I05]|nr:tyrosine-type recombinase/integrase [Sulfurimonas sp. SAG-AH-194-I05]MDF1874996.1 tyrosine-type recombinase/integrase [Sulfurimonas sp. SAG-AH-194-I05]
MLKLIEKYKQDFLESLEKLRAYSDLTIKSYDETLQEASQYITVFEENGLIKLNLMPYRIKMKDLNPKTISRKLSSIRSFIKYLNDNGISCTLESDDTIKVAKTLPKPIKHQHIIDALAKASLEEKLIVTMLYSLGLRISELSSLEVNAISEEWIRVIGKGNKQRDVPLLKKTKNLIDTYLEKNQQNTFLFQKKGERLSENSLRYIITKVFKRVALKVTPHQLRHSFATELLNNHAPISDVSELLGHSSMATTQIYTKLGSSLKKENYNKAHPLCFGDA